MTFFVSARRVTMSQFVVKRMTSGHRPDQHLLSIECHRVTDQIWGGTKVVASVTQIESPTTLCENCAFWRGKLVFASVTQIESPTRLLSASSSKGAIAIIQYSSLSQQNLL